LPKRLSCKTIEEFEQEFDRMKKEKEIILRLTVDKFVALFQKCKEDVIGYKIIELGRGI
jgi:hypothetical protein